MTALTFIPYTGQRLPAYTAEGVRHTIQIPDEFGELVVGFVYADDIEDVVRYAQANIENWFSVQNRSQIIYERDRR